MLSVVRDVTADNADMLDGTDLANIPEPGQLDLFVVSTAADTAFTITAPGQGTPIRAQLAQLKANAVVSLQDDLPISMPVIQGRYIIAIDITGAATVRLMAIFRSLDEILAEEEY